MIKINIKNGFKNGFKRTDLSSANDVKYQQEYDRLISLKKEYMIKDLKNGYGSFIEKKK